jgi:hypothetical protein
MRRLKLPRLGVILSTTIVAFVSIVTLLGLLFGDVPYTIPATIPMLGGTVGEMPTGLIARVLLRIAVVTLAFGIIIGLVNLVLINARRVAKAQTWTARLSSIVVLASFVAGLVVPVINAEWGNILLEDVQTTIESSLAGLLFFALVYGAFRILRRKVTWTGILFVLTVEIVLLGALPVGIFAPIRDFTDWLMTVPVNAGARGILLGIALATLVTGLRVLIGQDRSYGE